MQQHASVGLDTGRPEGEHTNFARALLDCITHGLIAFAPNRQIIAFNEQAERLTGCRMADLLGRPSSALPHALQAIIDESFVTGRAVSHRDILLAQDSGAETLLQVTTTVAHPPGGDGVLSVMAELQNIGQARCIASSLEHLDRLASLGIIGASVAHEIKNALVPVSTFVALPEADRTDPGMSGLVAQEIRRIDAVMRQVLRGATREEFCLEPVHLHPLLRENLNLLRHQFQARSIKLETQFKAGSDLIHGDDRQLRHATINLVLNAIEAMGEFGQFTVTTDVLDLQGCPHLRVSFTDTGCGISPENLERLFSPFFTTKNDGTGLGLVISRRIIQEHGGTITVESTVREGTTFHLLLPVLKK